VVRVQKIRVPDTGHLSWIVVDGEHLPVTVLNEYLLYLHRLGRSPNTVRAYAHHLQAFWRFLVEHGHDWQRLKLTQLAEFVSSDASAMSRRPTTKVIGPKNQKSGREGRHSGDTIAGYDRGRFVRLDWVLILCLPCNVV
jgi:hypothetical protein